MLLEIVFLVARSPNRLQSECIENYFFFVRTETLAIISFEEYEPHSY